MTALPAVLVGAALALGSAAAWTTLDALRKRLARELSAPAILLGIVAPQIPLHLAATWATGGWPETTPAFWALALVAAALTAAANLIFVRAVRLSPLSLTVPYLSFTPVLTLVSAAVLLGQVPGTWGLLGVATVATGALLLNLPAAGEHGGDGGLARRLATGVMREPGSRLMLAVAALFALTNAVDRLAIVRASEPAYAAALTSAMGLALVAVPGVRRELATRRRLVAWLLVAGMAGAVALLLQFGAYRYLYVAYVDAVKRAGGNLLSVAVGFALFSEGAPGRRLAAAALMSAGVALVLLEG